MALLVPRSWCATLLAALLCQTTMAGEPVMRTPQGQPGPDYWQQQVDYTIEVELNPESHGISAEAQVSYHNNSPQPLTELWFQLGQNRFREGSLSRQSQLAIGESAEDHAIRNYLDSVQPGFRALQVHSGEGKTLRHRVEDTYVRVELPSPLTPGEVFNLRFRWELALLDRTRVKARSGYELLADGSPIYLAAQWFPQAAVYQDGGWQLAPFLGKGEFSLEFGDFDVRISVPADYLVAATGALLDPGAALNPAEAKRLAQAKTGIRTQIAAPGRGGDGNRQWHFSAAGVRDFAFVASPALYWEAQGITVAGKPVLTQVFYPQAGSQLWQRYGLDAIGHTIREFSGRLFPYPWPVVTMVNIAGWGMEYPMLGVNPERGSDDNARWDMIGGIIHEVGHNWFPMAVNSNEREYAWMDEGLVAFVEYHVEKAWDPDFVIVYGEPNNLERYRGQPYQQPLMTRADDLSHRIDNAYDFAAAALNILRDKVLGPEAFDRALQNYACNWQFKRARPEDFFNAMAAASGRDLDQYWQQWFYGLGYPVQDSAKP